MNRQKSVIKGIKKYLSRRKLLSQKNDLSKNYYRIVSMLMLPVLVMTLVSENVAFAAEEKKEEKQILKGVNFVITGSVEHFANRSEAKELIESLGGKVTGSVTSKTSYLINNDVTSASSKNKKATELGIPIISEKQFLEMIEDK